MSQECVNSFVDSLEDLLDSSDLEQFNLTVNEESFQLLHHYANHVIHGKFGKNAGFIFLFVLPVTIASKCGVREDFSERIDLCKYLISGVLTIITVVVGTIGNFLSIITLLNR